MREDNVRKIWSEAELDAALENLNSDVGEDDGLAFARASLLAAAGVEEAPPAGPRRSGAWRWVAVAAAVVTLVGGLGVAAALWTPGPPETAQPAVLPELDRPLAPGEFRYAQKLGWEPQIMYGRPAWVQQKVELWIPADPAGVWHRRTMWTGVVHGLGPEKSKDVQVNLTPKDEYGPGGVFPGDMPTAGEVKPHWNTPLQKWLLPDAAFVASLVPDRGKLAKRLALDTITPTDDGRVHTATESLTMVRSVLELGLAPKNVRFALSDAFTDVNGGFRMPGHTPDGRPATILGTKDSGQRLYLDPATAQLLAWDAAQPTPVLTRSAEAPVSTSKGPPSATTSRASAERTAPPEKLNEPSAVYSFAITTSSG
ncbi:hypothetical protein [Amycolatopsis sp.]|uniref:hypothetical protein n=1 Tax=Amycolatopsis sp. TaxID=37632 RepID=UPI002D7E80C2|nr:hypothetical protein [Amycolatopsis sp.]HET6705794.1 hypothetical protein [Amycolatopsis sp.]